MAQWYRFAHNNVLGAIAAGMLATSIVACSGDPSLETTQEARTALSGEEVFRGIVFGEGYVAEQLPELWDNVVLPELTSEEHVAQKIAKAQLVADIREADPTFFDRFGKEIQSGDHLRIQKMMDDSGTFLKNMADEHAPSNPKTGTVNQKGTCLAITLVVAGNVVAVVNLVVAGNVAWTVNWVWSQEEAARGETQLERDEVVELLATRLATE